MKLSIKGLSVAAAFAVSAGFANAQDAAPAADKESVIMVLDGSGSMWGQIDGKAKIEIARGVIGGLLEDWDENIHLGLVAYGHRTKGSCTDIETLVNVGPVNGDALMTKVNAINPVGKTPISASVKQAADALKYTEEKATVILVSDGLETCEADPCALATELESKGVDFTAHVIGFDVAEEEQASLSCLAENTGGKFISAQNAGELTTAMAETVQAVKEPEPAPEPEPVKEAAGPQGVQLRAKLCETCDVLDEGLFWRIYDAKKDMDGSREEVNRSAKEAPFIDLVAGDYYVEAAYGKTQFGEEFSITAGETTTVELILNAGHVRVNATATDGGEALDDAMFYRVYKSAKNLDGSREEVDVSGRNVALFKLPAGDYVVRGRHGKAIVEAPVTVSAGELTEQTLNMNVGYLKATTVFSEGGSPVDKGAFYRVFEAKTNLAGDRKEIDVSGNQQPLFRLPAGEYVLFVKHGAATAEKPVTVSAGSLAEEQLLLSAGRIRATAVLESGGGAIEKGVFWRVYRGEADLEGKRQEVDVSGGAEPIFTLAAGDYVLSARYGKQTTEAEFSIAAGEEKVVEVKVNP